MDERINEFKALGGLLGAKFNDDKKDPIASDPNVDTSFTFLSPEDYEKMPEEERDLLTVKMMGRHKSWAGGTTTLGEEDASSGT